MRAIATTSLALTIALIGSSFAQAQQEVDITPPSVVNEENPKAASYGLGYNMGMNLSAGGITAQDLLTQEIIRGLIDALGGKDPAFEQNDVQAALTALGQKIMARKQQANKAFLAENKAKDGWQTTDSGLQYKVLTKGTGAAPTAESQVTVHYEGKLTNGQVFDSSKQRGQPASFGVGQVIPGWTEALKRMKVGDKWQLVIPPELAYGPQGSPPVIGPNEVLIFEVELLGVK